MGKTTMPKIHERYATRDSVPTEDLSRFTKAEIIMCYQHLHKQYRSVSLEHQKKVNDLNAEQVKSLNQLRKTNIDQLANMRAMQRELELLRTIERMYRKLEEEGHIS